MAFLDVARGALGGLNVANALSATQRQNKISGLQQNISEQGAGFDPFQSQQIAELTGLDPVLAQRTLSTFEALDQGRQKAFFEDAKRGLDLLNQGRPDAVMELIDNRRNLINQVGGDTADVDFVANLLQSGQIDQAKQVLGQTVQLGIDSELLPDPLKRELTKAQIASAKSRASSSGTSSKVKDFKAFVKTAGIEGTDEEVNAALISLGVNPRAVTTGEITIAKSDTLTEQVANSKSIIKQRTKFAELTGASRAKAIDSGIIRINKIDKGITNIGRAVDALNKGAGVGAIQSFLPSIRAASVELDQIQKEMALDVIGAVTFGALSQGELDLAKEVALPKKLNKEQLIQHLNERRAAQEKLRDYFNDQIQFLDQGGTVAGFLREQERNSQAATQPSQNIIRFDDQGNIIQ